MGNFWHIDAGNVTVLLFCLAFYSKLSVMSWQHKKMWSDFEKRHGINGKHSNGE